MLKAHAPNLIVVALALVTAFAVSLAAGWWEAGTPRQEARVRTAGEPVIAR